MAAQRDEAIPADLLEHLRRHIKPLAHESMRVQMSVARLLWFGTFRIREHVKYDGFLSYSHRELDEWFGRRKFKAINDRLDLFDITHWSWVGKFTKAYRMTAHTALTLERYFARRREQTTAMLQAIVAFEMHIVGLQCAVKLNQHRPESHAAMHAAYAHL